MRVFKFKSGVIRSSAKKVMTWQSSKEGFLSLAPPLSFPSLLHFSDHLPPYSSSRYTEFELFGGLIHWLAQHGEGDTAYSMSDMQTIGPMKYWKHTHRYIPLQSYYDEDGDDGNNTIFSGGKFNDPDYYEQSVVIDYITFAHREDATGIATRLLFNNFTLSCLFHWRSLQTQRYCNDT